MPVMKIDHKKITNALIAEVDSVESSDLPQQQKTQKLKLAATRFINALYKDGRKFSGKVGEKRRIGLDTAQRYISMARTIFEERGWKHHLFERDLERMKKRNPLHAEALANLEGKHVKETRLLYKSLKDDLEEARGLLADIEKINFSSARATGRVKKLAQKHSIYEKLIMGLIGEHPQQAMIDIEKVLREREKLAGDLVKLKINHEIMYLLQLPKEDAESLKKKRKKSLDNKQESAVAVDYKAYLSRVATILNNPAMSSDGITTDAIAPLTFAICAATGRRPIEVLIQGDFEAIDEHKIRFSGQAKKRFEDETHAERWFYSLVDSQVVINAVKHLRAMSKVREMAAAIPEGGDYRTANQIVNNRTASALNKFAKEFFGDKQRTIKDARSTWIRCAHDLWFERDPYWNPKTEVVFFTEMLGHKGDKAQNHYKSFKVTGIDPNYSPSVSAAEGGVDRLAKLKELDGEMPDLARADAAVSLHNKVKALVEADPDAKITQKMLTSPPISAFRDMVKRYLELCSDALNIEKDGRGRWVQKEKAEQNLPTVLVEIDDDLSMEELETLRADDQGQPEDTSRPDQEAEDEQEPETEQEAEPEPEPDPKQERPRTTSGKPRMTSEQLESGRWRGSVMVDSEVVATATADDKKESLEQAYRRFEDDNAIALTMVPFRGKGKAVVEIKVFDKVVIRLEEKGDGDAVEAAAWKAFQNRS